MNHDFLEVSKMFSQLIRETQSNPRNAFPEETANKILQIIKYSEKNSSAVPIIDIAKSMGFFVNITDNLPNNDSGFIIISPELKEHFYSNKGIVVSNKIKYGKARFVIAHEIGHYLFDFNEQTEAQFSHIFKEHYNKESQHDPNELRVNQFAACLLMPRSAFSESFKKLKSNPDLSLADIISTLAEQFAVTPKAATARIQELGLKVV